MAAGRRTTPVILVANKAEGQFSSNSGSQFLASDLGAPVAVSAEHGEGVADLFEALRPHVEHEHLNSERRGFRRDHPALSSRSSGDRTRASQPWSIPWSARSG